MSAYSSSYSSSSGSTASTSASSLCCDSPGFAGPMSPLQRLDSLGQSFSGLSLTSLPGTSSASAAERQQWWNQHTQTNELMHKLAQARRENETMQRAWSARCQTLEEEVARLARINLEMEEERRDLMRQIAFARSPGSIISSSFNPFDEPPESSSSSSRRAWSTTTVERRSESPARPKTPEIDPKKSMSKQSPPPCNSHYLNGSCSVPRCKFSHLYKLTPAQVEEMRRGAKFHLCNALKNGVTCEDPTCCYGHCCPRGSACGRTNCAFNNEQHCLPPAVASTSPARSVGGRRH
ncbi:hypothetical protein MVLG_01728 [Microbotryum lychnidis-dioicae p1A1 Lamole]|uniref:C3H1-type domain-containing protein n=1 Tax=Microbotryum lychnidis-dioicae (strain p1A1 Lamole / MvSl-1064) TaxID=683840 RepID=U5H301_USTV1|nr:hypothetical protein MVLG_01728 [Microbotryum lychnidis-dioicae p1A1 Lamole]|eukprot:KDE08027.1 hypothetical protein MVLG_01728 [Microbotryum lychnidis-dioicae p1A1 Lamole]